jgi:NAD+ synthase
MTDRLIIAMAQLNQRVGDLTGNADTMLAWRAKAMEAGAVDLVLFPEQQLIGYPAEDLVLKPAFQQAAAQELERLAAATADGGPAILVGSILKEDPQKA